MVSFAVICLERGIVLQDGDRILLPMRGGKSYANRGRCVLLVK